MNGFCTYTVEVHDDQGFSRDVPCAKPRVGKVEGNGVWVILCQRHFKVVENAMKRRPEEHLTLFLDRAPTAPEETTQDAILREARIWAEATDTPSLIKILDGERT